MAKKDPPLGKNVPIYLELKGYPPDVREKVLERAREIARKRDANIVWLQYVLVADGTITERDYGSPEIERIRRSLVRMRTAKPASDSDGDEPATGPRPRKKRLTASDL